jgi:hypothetical protein
MRRVAPERGAEVRHRFGGAAIGAFDRGDVAAGVGRVDAVLQGAADVGRVEAFRAKGEVAAVEGRSGRAGVKPQGAVEVTECGRRRQGPRGPGLG